MVDSGSGVVTPNLLLRGGSDGDGGLGILYPKSTLMVDYYTGLLQLSDNPPKPVGQSSALRASLAPKPGLSSAQESVLASPRSPSHPQLPQVLLVKHTNQY